MTPIGWITLTLLGTVFAFWTLTAFRILLQLAGIARGRRIQSGAALLGMGSTLTTFADFVAGRIVTVDRARIIWLTIALFAVMCVRVTVMT